MTNAAGSSLLASHLARFGWRLWGRLPNVARLTSPHEYIMSATPAADAECPSRQRHSLYQLRMRGSLHARPARLLRRPPLEPSSNRAGDWQSPARTTRRDPSVTLGVALGRLLWSRCIGASSEWLTRAALILLARTTMAVSSTTPTTSTGHSAPAKTAIHARVSGCGCNMRGLHNRLAATKAPIVVTSHPHRYTFSNILITPFLWRLSSQCR